MDPFSLLLGIPYLAYVGLPLASDLFWLKPDVRVPRLFLYGAPLLIWHWSMRQRGGDRTGLGNLFYEPIALAVVHVGLLLVIRYGPQPLVSESKLQFALFALICLLLVVVMPNVPAIGDWP